MEISSWMKKLCLNSHKLFHLMDFFSYSFLSQFGWVSLSYMLRTVTSFLRRNWFKRFDFSSDLIWNYSKIFIELLKIAFLWEKFLGNVRKFEKICFKNFNFKMLLAISKCGNTQKLPKNLQKLYLTLFSVQSQTIFILLMLTAFFWKFRWVSNY